MPEAESLEADVFLPRRIRGPLPMWVVLHGITVPGRRHPNLQRFAHALAAAPAVVVVPDLPPWRRLELDTACVPAALRAAVRWQRSAPGIVRPDPPAVLGFSVGATQALRSAAVGDPPVRAVLGFGGYADLEATVTYLCTGRYPWRHRTLEQHPDPYGRWIFAAHFLPFVDAGAGVAEVARALLTLAREVGSRGIRAWDPALDPWKEQLRASLPARARSLWDLLAPPSTAPFPPAGAAELAAQLAAAARAHRPDLDPRPVLPQVRGPVVLAHGRADRLIPFPETLRLAAHLPRASVRACAVLRLLAHSGRGPLRPWAAARELPRFLRLLSRSLRL